MTSQKPMSAAPFVIAPASANGCLMVESSLWAEWPAAPHADGDAFLEVRQCN